MDISAALPALMDALNDPDPDIRGRAEEDISAAGPNSAEAVPKLINLLADREESVRAIACITLSHIGPSASQALPALRKTLSDPSQWVRRCARLAIAKITGRPPEAALSQSWPGMILRITHRTARTAAASGTCSDGARHPQGAVRPRAAPLVTSAVANDSNDG
jgi:HEAT repeat protein